MKPRVLQVGKFFYPYKGGVETYLLNLVRGLKDEVNFRVLVSNTTPRTVRETVEGVEVTRVGIWGRLSSTSICPAFPFLLRRYEDDIVQIQHPDPMSAISYLLAAPQGKLVVVYHSDIVRRRWLRAIYRPFLLKLLKKADRIIATSPNYLESSPWLRRFRDKCVVIPMGIDLGLYDKTDLTEAEARKIRRKYGERIVLFVGRLASYKGLDYLIEAMEGVEGRLLIIGRGERAGAPAKLVERKGLGSKIFFLGEVAPEVAPYLQACSVFCLPSITRNEAFGIAQLEAMASRRPVVSTRLNTGVDYVNQDGVTGILVPPKDSEALRAALNRLLDDPELGRKMGEAGRLKVEKEFTREKMAGETLRLYRELLNFGQSKLCHYRPSV